MTTESSIEFRQVSKQFGENYAVKQLNLTIQAGELFVLVGASGSGKTTTLKMINRLEEVTSGTIYYHGQPLNELPLRQLRLQMGYVLQQIALFPNMTVGQNISLIPEMKRMPVTEIKTRVKDLLNEVGLDPATYQQRLPSDLSGGEQQRVGIIRAFAGQPKVVLMDEPFSALDPISREQLQKLTLKIHQRLNSTIVFVTHDMNEALQLGDRIGVMQHGQLVQVGTPDEIAQQPANEFVSKMFASAQTNDIYGVYLNRLKVLGYLEPLTAADQQLPVFDSNQTIGEVLPALQTHGAVRINDEMALAGKLTKEQLLAFMINFKNK
ncbi:ABC transporter ATP-binding protein [Loigolactobacillus coryniformis subsp. coryniformis]|jgi:osmoprotectant transport system ATP-binding protein|uniref:ABC-type quaternary amine transporter n=1 Tax=Loigolactobacillus coryniformis subsp. coryniformis KCTC 3167 = DSM 20001 TaxID=913848 RepID=A0A0R1F2M7_9LACO|nr:ABC transporter ATP-binding protein [Loigolactobacillus coryniformis]ATO55938.1 ABC transporter ATP-binding protein [Loigolactobacillus coryniformis subsp. coryniformis KCTC 3167 = DSM 20001]KRK15774.1 glycine betaine carnitine choline ABC transporter, ATP-binding protein [Loigolactobacillus coryniformis subsp. coryniformis KCTC 3167 = DSM 20001]OEH90570.1 ABC transporter ATP-binding protein [Loigolactobacillus coryniformis subsp. coryniformis]